MIKIHKSFFRSHLPLALFILIFAGIGTYFLISSFADPSPNIYIAQAATGSDNGTDCADAYPVSFFNTSSNWGTNTGQIGPGTTVHLCGTITSPLTAQGSGTSGSPITFLWENGASLSEPYCPSNGCFYTNNQTYLTLNGGTDGSILSTANGTELANQQSGVEGLKAINCNGCTIKDLNISDMYQIASPAFSADETSASATLTSVSSLTGLHVGEGVTGPNIPSGDSISGVGINTITLASAPTATAAGQGFTAWDVRINAGVGVGGMSYSGSNITIADNTLHDDDWAINAEQNVTDINVKLYGNNIFNSDHDLALVVNDASGGSIGPVQIYDNHFHDYAIWDTPSPWDAYHHDGIHCYTSDGGAAAHYSGLYIYNNRFDGDVGSTMTSQIFMEGTGSGTPCSDDSSNIWIFNNVVMGSPTNDTVEAMPQSGTHVVNNTATAGNYNGSQCYSSAGGMGLFENNVADLCGSAVGNGYNGVDAVKQGTTDYNVYGDSGGSGGNEFVWGGTGGGATYTDTFSTWKSDCGCDGHSQQVDNSTHTAAMLNADGSPEAGSPVIGAGSNLTSLCTGVLTALCSDINDHPRPATGAWDVGAFEYNPNNCFASPGSCGYPDPDYNGGNVGVSDCSSLNQFTSPSQLPAGTYYYSGSGNLLEVVGSNVTWSGFNFGNWQIYSGSGNNNFTLDNDCIAFDGGGNAQSVAVNVTGSGLTVENSTIEGANSTDESAELIGCGTDCTIKNDILTNSSDTLTLGSGSLVEDSYLDVNSMVQGAHDEDVYMKDASATFLHNTMLNPRDQTAVIFAEVGVAACDNQITAKNNLMAGGGYLVYACSAASSAGSSVMDFEDNRFGRCLGASTYDSSLGGNYCGSTAPDSTGNSEGAGADSNGFWPGGGFFGFLADFYQGSGLTWCGNYWDDSPDSFIDTSGSAGAPACPAAITDLNNDGTTNIFDLSIFLDHLGQTGTNLPGDFNSDGTVNSSDLSILEGQWGT